MFNDLFYLCVEGRINYLVCYMYHYFMPELPYSKWENAISLCKQLLRISVPVKI